MRVEPGRLRLVRGDRSNREQVAEGSRGEHYHIGFVFEHGPPGHLLWAKALVPLAAVVAAILCTSWARLETSYQEKLTCGW